MCRPSRSSSGRRAGCAARLLDPARAGSIAGGGALQCAFFPTARSNSSRTRPAAKSRLPEAVGKRWSVCAAGRSWANAASTSAPRRAAGPGCWRTWARTSSPSTRRRSIRASPRCRASNGGGRVRSASNPRVSVQWTGCSPTSFAIRPACCGLVERWRASGLVKNFVCTLKFQGETDHDTVAAFAAMPGAQLMHLHHN